MAPKPLTIVGLGIIGSHYGPYAVLQRGSTLLAVKYGRGKVETKTILTDKRAQGLATTTLYQRVFVAWNRGAKLYLTSYKPW